MERQSTELSAVSSEFSRILNLIKVYKEAKDDCPNFCGIHLEGPYFSPAQSGAQDPNKIRSFDKNEYDRIIAASDSIIRWSAAPELDGWEGFAKACREAGILACIGHSNANGEEVKAAFAEGFTHVTHLYTCTSMVHRIGAVAFVVLLLALYIPKWKK